MLKPVLSNGMALWVRNRRIRVSALDLRYLWSVHGSKMRWCCLHTLHRHCLHTCGFTPESPLEGHWAPWTQLPRWKMEITELPTSHKGHKHQMTSCLRMHFVGDEVRHSQILIASLMQVRHLHSPSENTDEIESKLTYSLNPWHIATFKQTSNKRGKACPSLYKPPLNSAELNNEIGSLGCDGFNTLGVWYESNCSRRIKYIFFLPKTAVSLDVRHSVTFALWIRYHHTENETV